MDEPFQKTGYLLHRKRGGKINIKMMVIVEVVLVIGPPTSPTKTLIVGLMMVILYHARVCCLQYIFS